MASWLGEHWREVLDVATALATIVAAVLAWRAIVATKGQAKKAADALVRERRLDFELDALDRIGDAYGKGDNVAFVRETIRRGLSVLPKDELPRFRMKYLPESTDAAEMASLMDVNDVARYGSVERAMEVEVLDAIRSRLDARVE